MRRPRYAFDARYIPRQPSGIGVYAREIGLRLPRLDPDAEFVFFFSDARVRDGFVAAAKLTVASGLRALLVPWGVASLAGQFGMARALREVAVDVFHSPGYLFPLPAFPDRPGRRPRLVVTIHDVLPLRFPSAVSRSRKRRLLPLFRWIHRQAIRRADRVLCVSETARREIAEVLRVPAARRERLVTIPNGVGARFFAAGEAPPAAGDGEPTLLYVGRSDPYKNLSGLVAAFALVVARAAGRARLVIAGSPDPRYPEPARLAAALGVRDRIEWTGYLPDEALLAAYRNASLLVHPSLYEGFGLPVLEAMACGTPVVASNRSSIPEVAGDAALLVDPEDPEALAGGILRVLAEPALAADLARRGRERARLFTWDRAAGETLAAYRSVL